MIVRLGLVICMFRCDQFVKSGGICVRSFKWLSVSALVEVFGSQLKEIEYFTITVVRWSPVVGDQLYHNYSS